MKPTLIIAVVLLAAITISGLLWAQPVIGRCPQTATKRLVWWNGYELSCVELPPGWELVLDPPILTPPTPPAPPVPLWQVETIPLTSLTPGVTSISYTTLQTPISGIVNWWYNPTNLLDRVSGVTIFTGQPVIFTLPPDWVAADTITVSYQSQ